MAKKSVFRETIEYDGTVWHLVYDPNASATMAAPSLQGANLSPLVKNKIKFPNDPNPAWIVTMGIVFPAATDLHGNLVNERRMLAFRTFNREPQEGVPIPYNDLAYYLAEPVTSENSAAQKFVDAIIGVGQPEPEQAKEKEPDASWTERFVQARESMTVQPAESDSPGSTEIQVVD